MAWIKSYRTILALAAGVLLVVAFVLSLNVNKTTRVVKSDLKVFKVPANDWTYVAHEKGWLEKEFEKVGIKIQIVEGTSGKETLLFSRDELHIAERMLYPVLLYKTSGFDISVVDVTTHPDPKIASILVPADSPIKTFDDLKGKKVASWRASCPYMVLFELAQAQNWKINEDFKFVNVPSGENKTVLLSKEVDAISAHPMGDVAPLLVHGLAREIANPAKDSLYIQGGGVVVNFTPAQFAKQYPDIVEKYEKIRYQTLHWMDEHQDEAADIVQKITRTPPEISKFSWKRSILTYKPERSYKKIVSESEKMQNWLIENGDITKEKRADLAVLFDKQFFDE